jgi:plastocyanin
MIPLPRLVSTAAAAVLLAACATSSAPEGPAPAVATAPPDSVAVAVENIAFKPAEIRVLRTTEVTWTNRDAGVRHTVTSGTGGTNGVPGVTDGEPNEPTGVFDGALPEDGTFSHTFNDTGTFAYFCEVHPSMRGTVIVE